MKLQCIITIQSSVCTNLLLYLAKSYQLIYIYYTGKDPPDSYLDEMMNAAPGPINFTMFLTMFGDKLNGTDPEDVIKNAFACFDEEGTGKVFCFRDLKNTGVFLSNKKNWIWTHLKFQNGHLKIQDGRHEI